MPSPPTASEHEWIKILVSAIAGLITGLVADPIKTAIQDHFTARSIYRALHREIAHMETEFILASLVIEESDYAVAECTKRILLYKPVIYEHYFDKNAGLFYSDERLAEIKEIFDKLIEVQHSVDDRNEKLKSAALRGMGVIRAAITLGVVDRELMKRYRRIEAEMNKKHIEVSRLGESTQNHLYERFRE